MKKISQRDIPSLEDGTYALGNGLQLRKRGKYANFFLRIQVDGRRRDVGIGSTKDLTLALAKTRGEQIRAKILAGEYDWEKKERVRIPTFGEFYAEALDAMAVSRQLITKSAKDNYSRIQRHALEVLGDKRLPDIDRDDVLKVLEPIWYEKTPTATRVRSLLENIFSVAKAKGYMTHNPARWSENLEVFLPSQHKISSTTHRSAPTFSDAANILQDMLFYDGALTHRAIIVTIFTSRRIREVLRMQWSDVDFESKTWTIPDTDVKVKRGFARRVPLPDQLVELLLQWKAVHKERFGDYVCVSDLSMSRKGLVNNREGYQGGVLAAFKRSAKKFTAVPVTVHGLRSTFTDWAAEHGEPVELVELSLDHQSGNAVRRAYFRSDLLDGRRGLLQRYADALFDEIRKQEKEQKKAADLSGVDG